MRKSDVWYIDIKKNYILHTFSALMVRMTMHLIKFIIIFLKIMN